MGYDDRHYYGLTKLVVKRSKEVGAADFTAQSDDYTYTGRVESGSVTSILIASGKEYEVRCSNASKKIVAGYGDCIKVEF